jgi:dipeptidyl aminopeptidase/acylaminoacyl peptidase
MIPILNLCLRAGLTFAAVSVTIPAADLEAQAGIPVLPVPASIPETSDPTFDLSVANIMRGELLVGRSPDQVRWSEDSRYIYYRWREPESGDTATYVYRVPAAGGEPERLADTVAWRLSPASSGEWSLDGSRRAVARNGDIYVVQDDGRERRITDTPTRESQPHLSPDGETLYYVSSDNIYALDLRGGPIRQLTDIHTSKEDEDDEAEGQAAFLEEQQRELFGAIRDEVAQRERRERMDSIQTTVPAVYLGDRTMLQGAEVSPSGRYALLAVGTRTEDTQTLVPNFVTESGYTEELTVRTKVGGVQVGQLAAILNLATGQLVWLDPGIEGRELSVMARGWAPREDRALLMSIPLDYKDRWFHMATPDGRITTIDHLGNEAWVGGPGLFNAGWLDDGEIYFVSERDGWAHLYTIAHDGGTATPITSGQWEVRDAELSRDGRTFYISTSEQHPGEQHLYSVPVDGGQRTRITSMTGWNEAVVSPDGQRVAVLHSEANMPSDLYIRPASPSGEPRRITWSTTDEFDSGPWIQPEIVVIPASDGAPVYSRIYRPRDVGAQPNGAAVVFVHGAGYLQNADRGWSSYFREYMFHHLLASRGYVVLDMDYRGSAGYGADWRTGIYRHMGGKDLSDQVDGVRWLVANEGVDAERIGIYGGSYGGFITLMALFTEPDVFQAGAALRSVTDWAHYNHGYTARILNQPQDDPVAYQRSSPIYFAEGLEGDLLIAHGMVDTNVHFQDVVRLAQRLIELGKDDWEMAVYPVEGHAFTRPESWTDEYSRILELFEESIGNERD